MASSARCLLLISALLIAAGCAGTGPVVERSMSGVDNYSEIDGAETFAGTQVGFGGKTAPEAMASLKAAGYTTVISLRAESEKGVDHAASRQAAQAAGLNYVVIPLSPDEFSPAAVDEALEALSSADRQPVYLHCGSASRAGAVWMIGRVSLDGLSRQKAAAEMRAIAAKPEAAQAFAESYLDSRGE